MIEQVHTEKVVEDTDVVTAVDVAVAEFNEKHPNKDITTVEVNGRQRLQAYRVIIESEYEGEA